MRTREPTACEKCAALRSAGSLPGERDLERQVGEHLVRDGIHGRTEFEGNTLGMRDEHAHDLLCLIELDVAHVNSPQLTRELGLDARLRVSFAFVVSGHKQKKVGPQPTNTAFSCLARDRARDTCRGSFTVRQHSRDSFPAANRDPQNAHMEKSGLCDLKKR